MKAAHRYVPVEPLELRVVRTTGDWHPNIDGDKVECRLYEYPPPQARRQNEVWSKRRQDYYDTYKGRKRWRITVWGGDDTTVEKWFDDERDARNTFDALDPCPNHTTLWREWNFTDG